MPTYTIQITSAEKLTVQESGEMLLSVLFDIKNGDTVLYTARHGFPLSTSAEDIRAELQKVADTFAADQANQERSKATDEANAQADQTIADLTTSQPSI